MKRFYVIDDATLTAYAMANVSQANMWRERWLPSGRVFVGLPLFYTVKNPAKHTVSALRYLTQGTETEARCSHCYTTAKVCCSAATYGTLHESPTCGSCCPCGTLGESFHGTSFLLP